MAKGSKECLALFSADTVPALIALGASIRIVSSNKEVTIPLEDFYTGKGDPPNILKPDELIKEILIPKPDHDVKGTYLKYTIPPGGIDFPIIGVAVQLKTGDRKLCKDIRIVLTGIGSAPLRVKEIEDFLINKEFDAENIERALNIPINIKTIPHMDLGSGYRRRLIKVFIKRALNKLKESL